MSQNIQGNNYEYVFKNILSPESCMVEIHVLEKTSLNDLVIHCKLNCYIMLLTSNIVFDNVNIVIILNLIILKDR
jgi:hypothetical protein